MKKYNFSVIFVLAVSSRGGGGNIVVWETQEMRKLGADVYLYNLWENKKLFEETYPDCSVPVIYGFEMENIGVLGQYFDVVCATHNDAVQYFHKLLEYRNPPRLAYYIQDYEPGFYDVTTQKKEIAIAQSSYTEIPDMVRFTKTKWNQREIMLRCGVECTVIGPSVNLSIFSESPDSLQENTPLTICAMVRLHTKYRSPQLTMEILRKLKYQYGNRINIVVFGSNDDKKTAQFFSQFQDFEYEKHYILTSEEVAELLKRSDIFADFSAFQAMGLTAMEAMASGCATIVPQNGGAVDYAVHKHNSLVIDTASEESCLEALEMLIEDKQLRNKLRQNALKEIQLFSTMKSADKILSLMKDSLTDIKVNNILEGIELFHQWLVKNYITIDGKKYIYGAGKIAEKVTEVLQYFNISYEGYVVTNTEENPKVFWGYPVISFEELKEKDRNTVAVFVALSKKNQEAVVPELKKEKFLYRILGA